MRSGLLYVAVCLTLAAFTQAADAKTGKSDKKHVWIGYQ